VVALLLRAAGENPPATAMFNRDKLCQMSKTMWGDFGQLIN
jgi:hypothetical protein